MGKEDKQPELDEEWLIFSRAVTANGEQATGQVELAFSLVKDDQSQQERIRRLKRSPLVVFFPTVLETHLGFLVQGPYRTTPSRDNVPGKDDWNKHLIGETASLLLQALRWLRDNDFLDTNGLGCLPIDSAMFGQDSMFAPLYDATKSALSSESLLPRFDAGHVTAACARIGRTQELCNLFTPTQLAAVYGEQHPLVWLSGDITQGRTPALRRYLMQRLDVPELTAETVIPQLGREYLKVQSDVWIERLYEFLSGQPSLQPRLEDVPLIRLENGTHVPPRLDGQVQAFLPCQVTTPRSQHCVRQCEVARVSAFDRTVPAGSGRRHRPKRLAAVSGGRGRRERRGLRSRYRANPERLCHRLEGTAAKTGDCTARVDVRDDCRLR